MKILHVLDHSLPIHSGYSFRSAEILRSQSDVGISVVALTGPKHYADESRQPTESAIEYIRCPYRNRVIGSLPLVKQLEVIRLLALKIGDVVADQGIEIIHAHSPSLNGIAALLAARNRGVPVVYEMRASWEDAAVDHGTSLENSLRYRATRATETWVLKRATAITTICEGLKNSICERRIEPSRVSIVPNAVDVDRFKPSSISRFELASKFDCEGRFVVVFCGSFYAYEGIDLLIEAISKLRSICPEILVMLAGGGEQECDLLEQVDRLGVGDNVRFLGRVSQDTVIELYSLANVCVFPRKRNKLTDTVTPLKPLEAMATGSVVMASKVGGHDELIDDRRTGLLFPADSAEALRSELEMAYTASGLGRLGNAAREYIVAERTWVTNAKEYRALYERILANGRVSRQPGIQIP
jgi:PEP-CTERM/exosortase A-associated glycosyltransferase